MAAQAPLPALRNMRTEGRAESFSRLEDQDGVTHHETELPPYSQPASAEEPMRVLSPLRTSRRCYPILVLVFHLVAAVLYFYIRATKTFPPTFSYGYALFVYVVEILAVTASLPYALLCMLRREPVKRESQLSAWINAQEGAEQFNFHVIVLIPCYKESLNMVTDAVKAAVVAGVPEGTKSTVYLCDEGADREKQNLMDSLGCEYVGRRPRAGATRVSNRKAASLNYAMQLVYNRFNKNEELQWQRISPSDIVVVLEPYVEVKKDFFLRLLEVMTDPMISACSSPLQAFNNAVTVHVDLFNFIDYQKWEYWLPGAVAWGANYCTSTNVCIRARDLARVGLFPTGTLAEGYALGMELQKEGCTGQYMLDGGIADGRAPKEAREALKAHFLACKGHLQVFFSWAYCPLLQWRLSLPLKLIYSYPAWVYIVNLVVVPVSLLVPFVSLFFGFNPLVINVWFAIFATIYYFSMLLVYGYIRRIEHVKSLWFASIASFVCWPAYLRAFFSALFSKVLPGSRPPADLPRQSEDGLERGQRNPDDSVTFLQDNASSAALTTVPPQSAFYRFSRVLYPPKQWTAGCCAVLDPILLFIMFFFCWATVALGVWSVVKQGDSGHFYYHSVPLSPYVSLPLIWAVMNCIPPTLFLVFCFSGTKWLARMGKLGHLLSILCVLTGLLLLWLSVPQEIDMAQASVTATSFLSRMVSFAVPTSGSVSNSAPTDYAVFPGSASYDVTGGVFMTADFVKYNMPLATSTALLAWSLATFPAGFRTAGTYGDSMAFVKSGANFLQKCLFSSSGSKFTFIAQVGDPAAYYAGDVIQDNPEKYHRFWTRLAQDTAFTNPRVAYVLNETAVGSDLLASSAAAIAAAAYVVGSGDPAYSQWVSTAKTLFSLAYGSGDGTGTYHSYCDYIPCVVDVPVQRTVKSYLFKETVDAVTFGIQCWTKGNLTCSFLTSKAECDMLLAQQPANYFRGRTECCTAMKATDPAFYSPQGACALPEGSLTCYIPEVLTRSCSNETISLTTTKGCTGQRGDLIFDSTQHCCSWLLEQNIIDNRHPGQGLCAGLAPTNSCYVVDVAAADCRLQSNCADLALTGFSVSDTAVQCCTIVASMVGAAQVKGTCKATLQLPAARRLLAVGSEQELDISVDYTQPVTYFNSTSVLDDIAWGALWLYKLTGDNTYLKKAMNLYARHVKEERIGKGLFLNPSYYVYNWDNTVWGLTAMLAHETGYATYIDDLRTNFLQVWLDQKVVSKSQVLAGQNQTVAQSLASFQTSKRDQLLLTRNASMALTHNITEDKGMLWLYGSCQASINTSVSASENTEALQKLEAGTPPDPVSLPGLVAFEDGRLLGPNGLDMCHDGIDNDCNGLTDLDDPSCQNDTFTPTALTSLGLVHTDKEPLPNVAHAAFLSVFYASSSANNGAVRRRLRCWALSQLRYILGENTKTGKSYVVLFGKNPPQRIPHRDSSCTGNTADPCSWDKSYIPSVPNPQLSLVAGALVAGPDASDSYQDVRTVPDSKIGVHYNVGLASALAALLDTDTNEKECGQQTGFYQDVLMPTAAI